MVIIPTTTAVLMIFLKIITATTPTRALENPAQQKLLRRAPIGKEDTKMTAI
jgi:hypothetical protein